MLKDLDVRETPSGELRTFSVCFVLQNGQRVFFPRAIVTGLKCNVRTNRMRGIQPVDQRNESTGHVYPVSIDNFLEYNGMEIIL